jgi:hypothetical protein
VFRVEVIDRENTNLYILSALAGDTRAQRLLLMLHDVMGRVCSEKPKTLCLLCDHEFMPESPPEAFVLLTPMRDDPSNCLSNGLCDKCFRGADLMQRITDMYRRTAISDLRVIEPHKEAGRA